MTFSVVPIGREFEDSTGIRTVETVYAAISGSASNQTLISGVAGERIRILGGLIAAGAAATTITLKSGTTNKRVINVPVNTVAEPNVAVTTHTNDVIELATGEALQADNTTAIAVSASFTIIRYTP